MDYDAMLPYYYNNNQRFLQKRLDPKIIRDTKIFEKTQIKWICIDDIPKMKKEFRTFYQNVVDLILVKKNEISAFIRKSLKSKAKKTRSKKNNNGRKSRRRN
jgi:transcription termination factor NusB